MNVGQDWSCEYTCAGCVVERRWGGKTHTKKPLFAQCTSVFLKTDLDLNMPLVEYGGLLSSENACRHVAIGTVRQAPLYAL